MTPEYLQKQLEIWKRALLVGLGASVTLLATAIADIPDSPPPHFPGWFAVWFMLQLATTPAGFALLVGKSWRALALSDRLNTAFGYLGVAWITLLAFGFKAGSSAPGALSLLVIGLGVVLAMGYVRLRRTRANAPEEMFP